MGTPPFAGIYVPEWRSRTIARGKRGTVHGTDSITGLDLAKNAIQTETDGMTRRFSVASSRAQECPPFLCGANPCTFAMEACVGSFHGYEPPVPVTHWQTVEGLAPLRDVMHSANRY